jgi:hypothetical protein
MRVVDTDNFGRDYPNEKFVSGVLSEVEANRMADEHNHKMHPSDDRYWIVVPDDYTLVPGFEP